MDRHALATRSSAGRPARAAPAVPLAIMSERLNADIASAKQTSLRFGDARVALKDILRLDPDKSVPGMLSRHGRTTLENLRSQTRACAATAGSLCMEAGNRP